MRYILLKRYLMCRQPDFYNQVLQMRLAELFEAVCALWYIGYKFLSLKVNKSSLCFFVVFIFSNSITG